MSKEKGKKWDGKSRPSTELYKQRWNEVFGNEDTTEELDKEEQEYLDSLKDKL